MEKINLKHYRHVGKVFDAHGIRGDLYCLVFSGDADWSLDLKSLILSKNESTEEYKVKKSKLFKKGFIVTLEGISDRNAAEKLKAAEIWVHENTFVSGDGETLYLSEILNFEVSDQKSGVIGKVVDFSSNGAQDLLIVQSADEGPAYEIPFVEDFVVNIDFKKHQILMDLPEGMLSFNQKDYENHDGSQNQKTEPSNED